MKQSDIDVWVRHRPSDHTGGEQGVVGVSLEEPADEMLVSRIAAAFRCGEKAYKGPASLWNSEFRTLKSEVIAFLAGDNMADLTAVLRDPCASVFHYGFDETHRRDPELRHGTSHLVDEAGWLYDNLRRVAEAVGAQRLSYPELLPGTPVPYILIEALLESLDARFGFRVIFPNPFPGERGLATSRGIASYRSLQSLYQAWRITRLMRGVPGRVVEIGGGLGRTALYSILFGVTDYVLIDLPLTGAAQANFLGRVLGDEAVSLCGEDAVGLIRIETPTYFVEHTRSDDLIVNIDSLTEMAEVEAQQYWERVRALRARFLSINHEANPITIRGLYDGLPGISVERNPYWLRRGYVDETISFAPIDG
jgi:hypothetical protein